MTKVVIVELKENYALAMKEGGEIIRIRRKPSMSVGDEVYILPEDLYEEQVQTGGMYVVGGAGGKKKKNPAGHWRKLVAMAAMVALVLAMVVPQLTTNASAVVSIDAQQSVQLTVDDENRVLSAVSPDGTIPDEVLLQLKGKSLSELTPELVELLGGGPFLVAYAPTKDTPNEQAEAAIRSLFADQSSVYFSCNQQDVAQAKTNAQTLPRYMLSLLLSEEYMDLLEDYYDQEDTPDTPQEEQEERIYEQMSLTALLDALKQNPALMQSEAFRDELFDKLDDAQDRLEHQLDPYDLDDDADDDMDDADDVYDDADDADDRNDVDDADDYDDPDDDADDYDDPDDDADDSPDDDDSDDVDDIDDDPDTD